MSFQFNFAHNYFTVRIVIGPLVGLAIQQPFFFFFNGAFFQAFMIKSMG